MKLLVILAAIAIYTGRVVETRAFLPYHPPGDQRVAETWIGAEQ